jgi:uncharacterized membrane protein
MHSKVKIAGHPLHPMLVGFPVTLYVVALVCFAARELGAGPFWFRAALYSNVAGVVMAALAAVPGLIDWAFAVPAGTAAKRTGLAHMLLNVSALIVFGINAYMQWGQRLALQPEARLALAFCAVGTILTLAAGFLGWKLVQTHHVGVDLTPEQERLEPRVSPPEERLGRLPEPHGRAK